LTIAIYQLNAEYSIFYLKTVSARGDIYQNYQLPLLIIKVFSDLFSNFLVTNKKIFYSSINSFGEIDFGILTTNKISSPTSQTINTQRFTCQNT